MGKGPALGEELEEGTAGVALLHGVVSQFDFDRFLYTYLLLCFLCRPTASPTTRATRQAMKITATTQMRRHPPLRATYALFLKSSNFSPLGPFTSHSVYVGGDRPL